MEDRNGEIHGDETEASGGVKTIAMRWVLGIGILPVARCSIGTSRIG